MIRLTNIRAAAALAAAVSCLSSIMPTQAQSFNIDIGYPAGGGQPGAGAPAAGFGAAPPQFGFWNNIAGLGLGPFPLNNLGGAATAVTLERTGPVLLFAFNDLCTPAGSGVERLMDDIENVGGVGGTVTYTISGLDPGVYRVLTYARAPDNDNFRSRVTVVDAAEGPQIVGGQCPAGFVQGVTHARHHITTPLDEIQIIVDTQVSFGSVNGIQLTRILALAACPPRLPPALTVHVQGQVHYPGGVTQAVSDVLTVAPSAGGGVAGSPTGSMCYSVSGLLPPPEPPQPPLPPPTIEEIWQAIKFRLWMVKSIVHALEPGLNVLELSCGAVSGSVSMGPTGPPMGFFMIELQGDGSVLSTFNLDLTQVQPQPEPPIAFEVDETISPTTPGHAAAQGISTILTATGSSSMPFSVDFNLLGNPSGSLPVELEISQTGSWNPSSHQATSQICILPLIPADLNHDGHVNGLDLALLLGQWTGTGMYTPCPPYRPADLNHDCKINGLDLAMLLAAWAP